MKVTCPNCDTTKKLIPSVHVLEVMRVPRQPDHGMIKVEGCEYYRCPDCGADPVYPDQIRRNEQRIKNARLSAGKTPALPRDE